MRYLAMVLILVITAGCASQAPQSTQERQALRIFNDARPTCTSGHEDAVSDGVVSIRPGETICINLEARGRVVSISGVTSVESESTLMLDFRRESNPASMVLRVWNPFESFLRYKANMLLPGASKYEYTSSCPVLSKRLAFEQWPHPIVTLKLSGFELIPEGQNVTCQ